MVTASVGCAERRAPVSTADPDGPQPSSVATQLSSENAWGAFMMAAPSPIVRRAPASYALRIRHVSRNVKSVQEPPEKCAVRPREPRSRHKPFRNTGDAPRSRARALALPPPEDREPWIHLT